MEWQEIRLVLIFARILAKVGEESFFHVVVDGGRQMDALGSHGQIYLVAVRLEVYTLVLDHHVLKLELGKLERQEWIDH